jgi:hypothetical protein
MMKVNYFFFYNLEQIKKVIFIFYNMGREEYFVKWFFTKKQNCVKCFIKSHISTIFDIDGESTSMAFSSL